MLTRIQRLIPFVVALIWGIDIHAQELISDIDTRKAGFTNINQACFTCGNLAYFTVNNEKGYELWRTDGSTEGTFRITDLNPGDASGVPGQFLPSCLNTTLFFAGDDGSGRQLWKTDGTIIGTSKVSTQSPIVDLHSYSDNIVFSTENQLWISNGSEEASLIIEFEKGLSRPSYLYCGEKYIYFSAINSVTNERELWRSDGTQFGTIFLKSIGLYAIGFEINGTMIFSGMDENGAEIWISDGSPEGTLLLDDIVPGELGSNPFFLGIFNDNVVFSAQGDIWLTDGTLSGTKILVPGISGSKIINFDSKLYCVGFEYESGQVVLISADESTTTKIADLGPFEKVNLYSGTDRELPILNDKIAIPSYNSGTGLELAASQGKPNDLVLVSDINPGEPGSIPHSFEKLGDKILFLADDGEHGVELWITDGSPDNTFLLKDTRPGTESISIFGSSVIEDKLLFAGGPFSTVRDIWTIDGAKNEANILVDYDNGFNGVIGKSGEYFLFIHDNKIYKSHYLTGDTSELGNVTESFYGVVVFSALMGNDYFVYLQNLENGLELWKLNAFENSINIVRDINAGPEDSSPQYKFIPQILNDNLYFPADDGTHGVELWISDGSSDGTYLLKDISMNSSNPQNLTSDGERIFLSANDGVHGNELWVTNGTVEATNIVKDIIDGPTSSMGGSIASLNSKVIFSASDGIHGNELWLSDGTEEGTFMLKDISKDGSSNPTNITRSNNIIFFSAYNPILGQELWYTNGTEDGTNYIDLTPGPEGSFPSRFTEIGNMTYFSTPGKLWRTTGSEESTFLVANIEPIGDLKIVGDWILFPAYGENSGIEWFKLPIIKMDQQIIFQPIHVKTIGDPNFELLASVTSGEPINFSTTSDKISISDILVELQRPGLVTIDANQPGNTFYKPAPTVSQQFCINPSKPWVEADYSNPSSPQLTSSSSENNHWYKDDIDLSESGSTLTVTEPGQYFLKIIVDGCESELSDPQQVLVTGLQSEKSYLKVSPNPANDILNITVDTHDSSIIQILNMNGVKLMDQKLNTSNLSINVSDYPNGVYILKLTSGQGTTVRRWIKG